jgi:hypothetical protein
MTTPPRATTTWLFHCHADPGYFVPLYEDIPDPLKDQLDANGGLPCDGGGHPGPWCMECRFGAEEDDGEL